MAAPKLAYDAFVFVPRPTGEQLGVLRSSAVQPGGNLNVPRMVAGTGDMMPGVVAMARGVFDAKGIPKQSRELIILRSAMLLDCPYEWQQSVEAAEHAGCTPQQIDAVAADGPVTTLGYDLDLIVAATDELTKAATLTDSTLQKLLDRFEPEITRKLILTIGWFNLLTRFLKGCRVPIEAEAKISDRT